MGSRLSEKADEPLIVFSTCKSISYDNAVSRCFLFWYISVFSSLFLHYSSVLSAS